MKVKKTILILLFGLTVGFSLNYPVKRVMQYLITRDYRLREAGKKSDRMYWVDELYFKWYVDDYFFYFQER